MKILIPTVLKNIIHSISISGVNALLNLGIWLIAPFYISPDYIGYAALLIAFAMVGTSLIENSFSSGIIFFGISTIKSAKSILLINLLIWLIYLIVILLYNYIIINSFGKGIVDYFYLLLMLTIPLIASVNTIYENLYKGVSNFKKISKVETVSTISGFITFILLLQFRTDFFPIIISVIIKYLTTMLLYLFYNSNNFKAQEERNICYYEIWNFGKYILGEKIMTVSTSYIDTFILSHTIGLKMLGIYELFKKIIVRPVILLTNAFENVAMPYLVKHNIDKIKYNNFYGAYISLSSLLSFGYLSLLTISSPLIFKLLPSIYSAYSVTFYLIVLFAICIILLNPIDLLLYSIGKSKVFFYWNLGYYFPLMFILIFSSLLNINSMIIALTSMYFILFIFAEILVLNKHHNLLHKHEFIIKGIKPLMVCTFAASFSIYLLYLLPSTSFVLVIICNIIFISIYLSLIYYEKRMLQDISTNFFKRTNEL